MNAWPIPGYREERVLGSGRSGQVVLATYTETGVPVAIKYLSDELSSDSRFRLAFRDQVRRMIELGDPHIVHCYGLVESPLGAAVVMEFVDGVSLREILDEYGSTSPEAALAILKSSLLGLSTAHGAGIVHRDGKPGNVLVQADGFSKLTDFGIATVMDGGPGMLAGTPPYMAPEQWNGAPAGPATDIYAATCVFFECLTGREPYRADHPAALPHLHQSAAIPVEAVPGSVRNLVSRGLAKNPADRPVTAGAFIGELETTALGAYGPEWERRGRRHLAELAAPLAPGLPLATPAPRTITTPARTRRKRSLRHGPRVLIGAGALAVAVTAVAVLAVDRHDATISDASAPQTTSPGTHHASPTPTRTPTPSPTPSRTRAPAPVAVKVSDLTIAGFDGRTATIRARTSTPKSVTLTVRFAEGASASTLTAGRTTTFVLTGSTAYNRAIDGGFATPSCGETVYRQVTVSTTTKTSVGARSEVVAVKGDPCTPPTVSISSWNGSTLSVRVRNVTPDPVTLTATFRQTITVGPKTVERTSKRRVELSGHSVYDQKLRVRFKTPQCGYADVRKVTVKVGSALGTAEDSARAVHKGASCAEPAPTTEPHTGRPPRGPSGEPGHMPNAESGHKPGTKSGTRPSARPRGDAKAKQDTTSKQGAASSVPSQARNRG
ncbi:hypothetical protein Psi02_46110 [Planotetraspora silvatica]|uniref:mitogen-activated protein kinase kinase n=1 Tax=Planotetraspora silvatica TaxID=234614 RepID=A0A8J3XN61_9ACTN|nr:serine/threonine-protein kinase [Planotetraspora silvatica]GII48187.1 hypothetical protein Psi02_46110 [Planotetraspora silvatica]